MFSLCFQPSRILVAEAGALFWQAENLSFVKLLALAYFLTPESLRFQIAAGPPLDTAFYSRDPQVTVHQRRPLVTGTRAKGGFSSLVIHPLGFSMATSLYSRDGMMLDKIAVGRGKVKTRVLSFPEVSRGPSKPKSFCRAGSIPHAHRTLGSPPHQLP